jgi:alpha-L-fucosidase
MIQRFGDDRDWFFSHRMGMFIHWGIYALTGLHEQAQWRYDMDAGAYQRLALEFNPVNFDPDAWIDLARECGMEYLCFTTKHLDGFCLWDTRETEYRVTRSRYGRDTLGLLAEACHRRGMPLCLYYSIGDWHHPHFPNVGGSHELDRPKPGDSPNHRAYLGYVRKQVEELCTGYGRIHGFWWDAYYGQWDHDLSRHEAEEFNAMIRRLQPGIMINDRGFSPGDFTTPEREIPAGRTFTRATEACQSVGVQSWGFRADEDFYSDMTLIRSVDTTLAMGGNFLLNVGPAADGTIPGSYADVLRRVGSWYAGVREAFDDAEAVSALTSNSAVLLTRRGDTLYVHCPNGLDSSSLELRPLARKPRRATLVNSGVAIDSVVDKTPYGFRDPECLRLRGIQVNELAGKVAIFKLEFAPGELASEGGQISR